MTATNSDLSFSDSVRIAAKRALGGGLAGMAAMTIQVSAFCARALPARTLSEPAPNAASALPHRLHTHLLPALSIARAVSRPRS